MAVIICKIPNDFIDVICGSLAFWQNLYKMINAHYQPSKSGDGDRSKGWGPRVVLGRWVAGRMSRVVEGGWGGLGAVGVSVVSNVFHL